MRNLGDPPGPTTREWRQRMHDDFDPTAFAIDFDPTQQRMRGIAQHGHTPFDVPFISQITENLWQGGCENGLVLPETIDYVISLYPWERYKANHELKGQLYVKMYDSIDQTTEEVEELAVRALEWMQDGTLLVHCQAGLNRSSLLAARILMLGEGMTADEAIRTIRDNRSPACLCNPAFEKWLRSMD
jgi:protein-tyrosine phosphatase